VNNTKLSALNKEVYAKYHYRELCNDGKMNNDGYIDVDFLVCQLSATEAWKNRGRSSAMI